MSLVEAHIGWRHTDDPGEPQHGHPRLSISELEGRVLAALALNATVFEIGTGLGVSTRALAQDAIRVVTYDIDPWVAQTIVPTLADLANVTAVADREPYAGTHFDLVFIDADHATEAVRADIAFARTLTPERIVCHDAKYGNVAAALEGDWRIIDTEHGLAVA